MSSNPIAPLVVRNGHAGAPPVGASSPGPGSSLVTIAALLAALRRRWRLCAVTAVIGLVGPAAFSFVSPPDYSATAILQVSHPAQGDPSRAMLTDAELVRTRTVARGAISSLGARMSPRALVADTVVTIVSDDLLRITVKGPTQRAALRRANAVTTSFLSFRREIVERQLALNVETIERRKQALVNELNDVNNAINNSPAGSPSVEALGELLLRRATLNDQIVGLEQRIRDATNEVGTIIDNSRTIDPPSADSRGFVTALLGNLTAGLVAGLALGLAWIITQEVIFDRVRGRMDAASILGAPVPLSVGRVRVVRNARSARGERRLAHPEPDMVKVVEHLRQSVGPTGGRSSALAVVSLQSDRASATAVATLATELAREEQDVLLVDLTASSALARMCGANHIGRTSVHLAGQWIDLVANPLPGPLPAGDAAAPLLRDADVVLSLVTLDPAVGAAHLLDWARRAVAIVTAGRSAATALHAASVMLANVGIELRSGILLAADPNDETVGTPEAGFAAARATPPPAAWAR